MEDHSVFPGLLSKPQDPFVGPKGKEVSSLGGSMPQMSLAIVKGHCRITRQIG